MGFLGIDYLRPSTRLARVPYDLAFSRASTALALHLLKDSRSKLRLLYDYPTPTALGAGLQSSIGASTALTCITDLLFLDGKFSVDTYVKVSERHRHPRLHVRSSSSAPSKVPSFAKEAREEVEWIVCGASAPA